MSGSRPLVTNAAMALLAVVGLCAVIGPWMAPFDPDSGELGDALARPSTEHWLGTDYLGRDIVSRIIAGSRVAAIAGIEATAVALVLGVTIGMVIGLAGGSADRITMRVIDGISAIPVLVLAIAIIAALGAGLTRSMFAVGVAFATSMARLVRGLTLSERERLYVEGARVTGAGRWRLLRHHVAPNITGPIAVQATLVFAAAITIEAGLSFLGLGVQPPAASWGSMLASAQRTIREAPFQAIPPGLAVVLTVLSINVLGDAVVRRRRGESYTNPTGYLVPVPIERRATTTTTTDPGDPGEAASGQQSLLRASGLTVRYGTALAVDAVQLTVAPGEVVALVGESGSGKTSLAMALAGLLAPPATAEAAGVRLDLPDGHLDLVGASPTGRRRWRANVGVVFQEPSASLNPLQTVDRQLRDVLGAQRRVSGAGTTVALDDEVERLLTAVGLPRPAEVRRLRPGQLSGGMAQRVMIALALAKNPALLVADEPTTALDVTVQAEIIRLLRRLCAERHFGVLLVTHDLGVAGELADRCLVMFRGQVIESAPTGEVVAHPWHPYTSALVSAVPQNEPGRPILTPPAAATGSDGPLGEAGCPYRRRCPYAIERCTTVVPGLEAVGATGDREPQLHRVACHRAAELDLEGAVAVAVVADGDEVAR